MTFDDVLTEAQLRALNFDHHRRALVLWMHHNDPSGNSRLAYVEGLGYEA
jgi:hypothetical protein